MKKGIIKIISGVLVGISGFAIMVVWILLPLIESMESNPQFMGPGELTYHAEEPGNYFLYNQYRAMIDGVLYDKPESLPDGFQVAITDEAGTQLEFHSDRSFSFSSGETKGRSVGYVQVTAPTTLEIQLSGFEGKRPFSFGPNDLWGFMKDVLLSLCLIFLGLAAGAGLIIWGIVDLTRKPKKEPPPLPA
ncbi:hypothetical protein [Cerasicoccus fimbriatus]|uniref:hypothetical protein n=1 Tax=Cerasicoccus fimbriatus TaxID=3014554 RepID=UPI0022B4DC77|nr:hypothetical protein [Cerasicoccus sp. TK19100]